MVVRQKSLVPPALAEERIGRWVLAKELPEVTFERLRFVALRRSLPRFEPAPRRLREQLLVAETWVWLPGLAAVAELASELSDRPRHASSLLVGH